MQGDLAFVAAQLLDAYRGVDVDREHQVVDLHFIRCPVILVALVADLRILLVALEHERPGTDRLLIDVAGASTGQQLFGVFSGEDGGEAHGQVLDERGIDGVQGEHHGQWVGLLDAGDVLVQAHAVEIGKLGRVGLTEPMTLVEHAVEGEQHIVGVERAARAEGLVAVELDPFTQVEGVAQAVVGHLPVRRQGRVHGGAATFELDQAVVDGFGGVVVGGAGVLGGVEAGGAAFGAEHQVVGQQGRRLADQAHGQQGGKAGGMAHGKSFYVCLRRLGVRMAATGRRPRCGWRRDDMKGYEDGGAPAARRVPWLAYLSTLTP
ncbi:hypothetical protein D3C80_979220 [compost metagenome]